MYSTFLSVALFFTFAINPVFADFAVSTPEIQACPGQSVKVSWEPATAPYNLLVVSADDACGDALIDLGNSQETFTTFKADQLKVGQKVEISVEDAQGEEGWSGEITVKECASASSSAASYAASSASGSSSADSVAVAGTTLVVTPTYTVGGSYASSSPSSPSVAPVGAANAAFGSGSNAAPVSRHLSIPALVLTAVGGAITLLL